jgi:chitin disaccharide deacetylase
MSNNLLIIADDLGLHPRINDGIIEALKSGWITGASLMANGAAFDDAVEKYKVVRPPYIGLHLVLVEEKSLTGIVLPNNHKVFFIQYILGLIKLSDIEKELRAQINKCIDAGIRPAFINSHQHLHLLPGVMDIVVGLAKEFNISYIRTVNEVINIRRSSHIYRSLQLLFLNLLTLIASKKIIKNGLKTNNYFVGFLSAGNLGEEDIKKAKKLTNKYPDKTIELGCHPGYEDKELKDRYRHWGNYNWQNELSLLKKAADAAI